MQKKAKNKLEVLWQDFENSGSIAAYLQYRSEKEGSKKKGKRAIKAKLTSRTKI